MGSLMIQEEANKLLQEKTRELILTENDKFKLSISARVLKNERKSILRSFTLAEYV